ncbi:MAG: rRNA maturation RNase YbeY [Patescibacteria group bacterium]|nr:rRNA maturation RNase YbeY [Patescibacteria group bacterium]
MAINLIFTNETQEKIDENLFTSLIPKIKADGEVSLAIVDDETIQALNKKHRKKDAPTDVLSFVYSESEAFPGENLLGEIYISIDTAKRQAENLEDELQFLFIHGVLHLLGHTHETDEKYEKMMGEARSILGR